MANAKFCIPNWVLPTTFNAPIITGAGWIDLGNLQGPVLSEMARYPGVNPANTKLLIDLRTTRAATVFALPFHNAQPGDTARIRLATDSGMNNVVLDTGFKEFFGEVYPYGSLEWGRPEWLNGRLTQEQAEGKALPWIHIEQSTVLGRYLEVQLDFSSNTDGYVDIGQVVASPALSMLKNFSYGANPPFYRDPSTKRRSKGGVQFVDAAEPYRVAKIQFDWLTQAEVYGALFEMVREYGLRKPFFYIHDADAGPSMLPKQSFMAAFENIGDPSHTSFAAYSQGMEISEQF